jgi:hypothetical protein
LRRFALLIVVPLLSCAPDPKKVQVTEQNKDKLLEEMKDMKGLTVDETRMLIAYGMRQGLGKAFGAAPPSMVGKTVGDIIADQRSFETDAKKRQEQEASLAAEAKAKEEARAAELRKALSLTVFKKGFEEASYQEYITLKCAYENTSGKDIRAFAGRVRFTDLFGKPIYDSGLTISDPIKAGAKATWDGSIRYNQFNAEQSNFRNTDLKDMKIEWVPNSILFEDGTRIGEAGEKSEG